MQPNTLTRREYIVKIHVKDFRKNSGSQTGSYPKPTEQEGLDPDTDLKKSLRIHNTGLPETEPTSSASSILTVFPTRGVLHNISFSFVSPHIPYITIVSFRNFLINDGSAS